MATVYWKGDVRVTEEKFVPITELSREAQEKAWERFWLPYTDYPWGDENRKSLEAFADLFDVEVTNWEYGFKYHISYRTPLDWGESDLYSLEGVRLWKYLKSNQMVPEGDCPFTGFYLDEVLLEPIRDFLERPRQGVTMEDLVHEALWKWVSVCHDDHEHYYSFENFLEIAEANDWKFTEDGTAWA